MTTSTAIALVQALLTPNLKGSLPIVIMLLMIQGIHPEIIFELIPYVQMTHRQYHAIIIAWTQLRLFASLLPAVNGVKHRYFRDQRRIFSIFPQYRISRIFVKFQQSVLSSMLVQCGFAGTIPSLEVVQHFASNLAVIRMSPYPIFQIEQLFMSPNADLVLLKTALTMQRMIAHVRFSYPHIVSFLEQNKKAVENIISVYANQVSIKQVIYGVSFDILEPAKINDLFTFFILAVIDPEFIDETLAEVIQNCGDLNASMLHQKHYEFLIKHCQSIEPLISNNFLDIGKVLDCFSSMVTSTTREFQVRYVLRHWRMAFGEIVHSGEPEFEEVTIEVRSSVPIFDVFLRLWHVFFRNFARTFEVSFLPFGNILWSEAYTRLCTTNFDWIIRIVVGNFAIRIGARDDHTFFKSQTPTYMHTDITSHSYGMYIFPDGIRNCKMSSEICSCFLRDFWHAHRKPDPNMSDIDYIRWLFSIPGTFEVFGKVWIQLVDALQNGTELPKIRDGSSGDFRYLSDPTAPTDPEVQQKYDDNFGLQLGRYPEIGDYAEDGR